jgi:hypothetical protein
METNSLSHPGWRHAAALLAGLAAAAGIQAATPTLSGTVLDARSGSPIAGAIVSAGARETRTGSDGRFILPAASDADVTDIHARAPGFGRTSISLDDSQTDANVLKLEPLTPKAVYLSVFGIASQVLRQDVLALQQRTAINALVIDVKGDRGMTPYPSAARRTIGAEGQLATTAPRVADFAELLRQLHARGLYLIARIVVFKDDPLAAAHPEWSVHDSNGAVWHDRENLRWIDPTIRQAWQQQYDIAEEAARLGFDEIQFDYLRFPDAGGLRFSQDNTQAHRVAAITDFLAGARTRLRPYNVFVSADIFGYVCWNLDDTSIGQRIDTLAASLDYISPMLYPSGFTWGLPGIDRPTEHPGEIIGRSLEQAKRRAALPGVRFRPWLQAFRDYAFDRRAFNAEEIQEQVQAAQTAGTDGWMLWNSRNHYDPDMLPH